MPRKTRNVDEEPAARPVASMRPRPDATENLGAVTPGRALTDRLQ